MPQLLPPIRTRFYDSDGQPLVGGKVYSYTSGTTTPKNTYTTYGMGAANTNPTILDSNGEATFWLDGSYKIRVTDSDDNILYEEDNVRDLTSSQSFASPTITGTPTFTSTAVTWSGNPTHSGNHTFSGNVTVNGNTAVGNASTDTLTIAPNAVTWSNNPTHSGNHTFSGTVSLSNTAFTNGYITATEDGRLYGNALHDNANAVTGTTNQYIASGKHTPTFTSVTNIASTSNQTGCMKWTRVGNVVSASVDFVATPTAAAATLSEVGVSLPIASNLPTSPALNNGSLAGSGATYDTTAGVIAAAQVIYDGTNDRARVLFNAATTNSHSVRVCFKYEVL